MKSQEDLLVALLLDAGDDIGFDPSRDIATVTKRIACEGEAFMSITLPRLDDLLVAGLRDGQLPPFEGWLSRCAFPEFLKDLWVRIFSVVDGVLLDRPCVDSIRWVRQISRFHKKLREVCPPDRVEAAIDRFVELDAQLPSRAEIRNGRNGRQGLDPYAPMVCQILFGEIIGRAMSSPLEGKHGPGSVSERLGTNSRWDFESISYSISSLLGDEFFKPTWESLQNRPPSYKTVPARLVAVPKTAEKPRLISIEPSYNQFAQQALMLNLKHELERAGSVCSFRWQKHNRHLAKEASMTGQLATIDMSDASDRVSMALVEELFGFNPGFLRYLRLSRSAFVQVREDELVLLRKFASMGSALTFPVEAMVFTALVVTSICRRRNDFRPKAIKRLGKRGSYGLSVYGDDIILPVDDAQYAIENLESVGLKVNRSKSFLIGKFRESCGFDGYDGWDVTPIYLRRRIPLSRNEVDEVSSLVAFRNQIWERSWGSYSNTIRLLDKILLKLGLTHVPFGVDCLGLWVLDEDPRIRSRWNAKLQREEYWALKPVFSYREDKASDDGTLFKCLMLNRGGLGPLDVLELESAAKQVEYSASSGRVESLHLDGRPVASKLYYRWLAA